MKEINKCPVCGKENIFEFDICPVCGWENDPNQLAHPDDLRWKLNKHLRVLFVWRLCLWKTALKNTLLNLAIIIS